MQHLNIIQPALAKIESEGKVELQVSTENMLSVIGSFHKLGLSARAIGVDKILVEPIVEKETKEEDTRVSEVTKLLLENDPAVYETQFPKRDGAFLRYKGFHNSISGNSLTVSRSPIKKEKVVKESSKPAKESLSADLTDIAHAIQNELEYSEDFGDSEIACRVKKVLKGRFGTPLLVIIRQYGRVIKVEYRPTLPESLPFEYSPETVLGWIRALSKQIGEGSAMISYNKFQRSYGKAEVSVKDFRKMVE